MGIIRKCIRRVLRKPSPQLIAVPSPVNAQQLLAGKVALITGGSSGIGFAIAKAFLDSGCKVILAGRSLARLEEKRSELGGDGIACIELDVCDPAAMPEKVSAAAALFPENRIDILVNSAGVNCGKRFPATNPADFDAVMNTNIRGTYFMSQAVADHMIERGIHGHILNLSSAAALRPAWGPYQISKWAVRGMTMGMADKLLPHGITVNAIAPGPTATPMLNHQEDGNIYKADSVSKRYAVPSEIAALAVFMASDMGNLIVGDSFYITGGSGTISMHN